LISSYDAAASTADLSPAQNVGARRNGRLTRGTICQLSVRRPRNFPESNQTPRSADRCMRTDKPGRRPDRGHDDGRSKCAAMMGKWAIFDCGIAAESGGSARKLAFGRHLLNDPLIHSKRTHNMTIANARGIQFWKWMPRNVDSLPAIELPDDRYALRKLSHGARSDLNSLLTGKLTGNFVESRPLLAISALSRPRFQQLGVRFPTQQNREFPNAQQGKYFGEQGICTSRSENRLGSSVNTVTHRNLIRHHFNRPCSD
jgi:hypothetical protein